MKLVFSSSSFFACILFCSVASARPLPLPYAVSLTPRIDHYFAFDGRDLDPYTDSVSPEVIITPRPGKSLQIEFGSVETNRVDFAKRSSYGEVSNSSFQFGPQGTIATWLKYDRCPKSRTSYGTIAARYDSKGNQRGFVFGLDSRCRLSLITSADGGKKTVVVKSETSFERARWTHVAIRLDGGGKYKFFVNGRDASEGELPAGYENVFQSRAPLTLGAATRSSSAGDLKLEGSLDLVLFSHKALSDDEIRNLHAEIAYRND